MSQDGMHSLEGHRVNVALSDGKRIDDCQLVSAGRGRTATMWLYSNGADVFVAKGDVIDIRESQAA